MNALSADMAKILERLQEVAAHKTTTTYKHVAQLVGVPWRSPYLHHTLLGGISTSEFQAGRPLITALVVRVDTARPGVGFYRNARDIGAYDGSGDEAFWQGQVARIYNQATHP